MVTGTLYTYPENFRAYKALIAAEYSGAKVKVASEAPEFVLGETNKSPEFLAKFPLGKVPAFASADGKNIFESNAIAYYLANEQLRGKSIEDQAFVQQWISFADNEILPPACTWVFPCMGIMPFNKQASERAQTDLKAALAALNEHLKTKTFLVGERVSLADICCMANLLMPYKWVLDPEFRAGFNNVTRWFLTMVNQPQVKKVVGDFALCAKMAVFDAKKFAEFSGKGAGKKEGKAEKAPKQEKTPKEKTPKKEEKPKEAAAPAEEEEPAPKKDKDPFAAFPKSTFILDEFKRIYSNEDIKTKAIPYFWENLDKANYSIWMCEYKFPEDLGMTFQIENLIEGMYQRLDKLNKNSFASMCVFGKSRDAQIQGLWVWRTKDLAFNLSENWQVDYESYDWHCLDLEAESTKQRVEDFFLHSEATMTYTPNATDGKYAKYAGHKLYSESIFK
jgi:elongation factor 1-gamma